MPGRLVSVHVPYCNAGCVGESHYLGESEHLHQSSQATFCEACINGDHP